ncbi:hypothetical protein VFPBJ_10125 [Purpureocillium lilacinum]|uniref:Uncharacterized protein n=1 Tax=Purpureocillium lilacinum TaxID=33203 RepID=A0A179GBG4_PURLI|nr:hypothetical protein VFPBJ_10125 [Purpureocillium lilacinum]
MPQGRGRPRSSGLRPCSRGTHAFVSGSGGLTQLGGQSLNEEKQCTVRYEVHDGRRRQRWGEGTHGQDGEFRPREAARLVPSRGAPQTGSARNGNSRTAGAARLDEANMEPTIVGLDRRQSPARFGEWCITVTHSHSWLVTLVPSFPASSERRSYHRTDHPKKFPGGGANTLGAREKAWLCAPMHDHGRPRQAARAVGMMSFHCREQDLAGAGWRASLLRLEPWSLIGRERRTCVRRSGTPRRTTRRNSSGGGEAHLVRGPGATRPRLDMVMSVVCVRLLVPDASECMDGQRWPSADGRERQHAGPRGVDKRTRIADPLAPFVGVGVEIGQRVGRATCLLYRGFAAGLPAVLYWYCTSLPSMVVCPELQTAQLPTSANGTVGGNRKHGEKASFLAPDDVLVHDSRQSPLPRGRRGRPLALRMGPQASSRCEMRLVRHLAQEGRVLGR